FLNINGVQNEWEVWTTPMADLEKPDAKWQQLVVRADDVTSVAMRGDQLFLLSHHGAPTFQVLQMRLGQKVAEATVLLPARSDRVVESIHAAKDALYVVVREGVYGHLLRIPAGGT